MAKEECDGKDVMRLGPEVGSDGSRLCVRHTKDHVIQTGVLRPLKDGQSLNSDYACVALEPREDGTYDVEELTAGKGEVTDGGPAMVNSEKFKTGWDRIFGKQTVGVA